METGIESQNGGHAAHQQAGTGKTERSRQPEQDGKQTKNEREEHRTRIQRDLLQAGRVPLRERNNNPHSCACK